MADTIKTQVMKALETVLRAGVPEAKTVKRQKPIGADLEKLNLPVLFLYETPEEERVKGNRYDYGIIALEIAVFIRLTPNSKDPGFQKFDDQADAFAGRVYMALWHNPALKGLVLKINEQPRPDPQIGNESFGWQVLRYRITYGHAPGDAFTMQIQ